VLDYSNLHLYEKASSDRQDNILLPIDISGRILLPFRNGYAESIHDNRKCNVRSL
jgi:hypothetical protein